MKTHKQVLRDTLVKLTQRWEIQIDELTMATERARLEGEHEEAGDYVEAIGDINTVMAKVQRFLAEL